MEAGVGIRVWEGVDREDFRSSSWDWVPCGSERSSIALAGVFHIRSCVDGRCASTFESVDLGGKGDLEETEMVRGRSHARFHAPYRCHLLITSGGREETPKKRAKRCRVTGPSRRCLQKRGRAPVPDWLSRRHVTLRVSTLSRSTNAGASAFLAFCWHRARPVVAPSGPSPARGCEAATGWVR